jgi:hypothetical protein
MLKTALISPIWYTEEQKTAFAEDCLTLKISFLSGYLMALSMDSI